VSTIEEAAPLWRRSTMCHHGECVEAADSGNVVLVRESSAFPERRLEFSPRTWRYFIEQLKSNYG
jgi:hypothetical protein